MPEITINQKVGQTIVEIRQKKGYTQAQFVRMRYHNKTIQYGISIRRRLFL